MHRADGGPARGLCPGASGRGAAAAGTADENAHAWIMAPHDGEAVNGTAFFGGTAFSEPREIPPP